LTTRREENQAVGAGVGAVNIITLHSISYSASAPSEAPERHRFDQTKLSTPRLANNVRFIYYD
jgi:hypothetical protein